jgi:hypothetical protein
LDSDGMIIVFHESVILNKNKPVITKTFPKKIDKNFNVSFSSTFLVLSRFWVFLSDGSSKALNKTFYKKHRFERFLQKIRPKIQNRFFLSFVLSRLRAFLGEGSSTNKSDPIPFPYSDPPTNHHGGHRFFCFCRPCTGGGGAGRGPKWGCTRCMGNMGYRIQRRFRSRPTRQPTPPLHLPAAQSSHNLIKKSPAGEGVVAWDGACVCVGGWVGGGGGSITGSGAKWAARVLWRLAFPARRS